MILAGAVGYVLLPVAQFPEIAPPQVVVSSSYGTAGPHRATNSACHRLWRRLQVELTARRCFGA